MTDRSWPITTAGGVSIEVHELGGVGTDVILAHGTGLHGHVWRPLVEYLGPERFRCFSFDARGHGKSGLPPDGDFDWHSLAADVLDVVDSLKLTGAPSGFGHSSGATVLLLAEQLRPGTFSHLYCFEPIVVPVDPPLGRDPESWLAARARRRRDTFASRDAAYEHYSSKPPFDALEPAALRSYIEHGVEDVQGSVRLRCRPENEALLCEMATAHDCFGRLPHIGCPVLLASGECSDAFPVPVIRAMADRLPRSCIEILPGLDHLGPLAAPAEVAASVRAFLCRNQPAMPN